MYNPVNTAKMAEISKSNGWETLIKHVLEPNSFA